MTATVSQTESEAGGLGQKLDRSVLYHIYPSSFQDSNGDGCGDLEGIRQRLDYLDWIGCDYAWLSPIYQSAFADGGYDITDFRAIAPRFGTLKTFRSLVGDADRRRIGLILDLVPGHTSADHPWFQNSAQAQPGRYRDYYIWSNHTFEELDVPGKFNAGLYPRDGQYLANFFPFQPALNYGYAVKTRPWQHHFKDPVPRAVKRELYETMRFWLDQGISGFRVDMASSLIKGDDTGLATREFWTEIREWMDRDYPDALLISEWSRPDHAIPAGFHVDFLLHYFTDAYNSLFRAEAGTNVIPGGGHSYFRKAGQGNLRAFLEPYLRFLQAVEGKGLISIPTGNHDLPRLALGRDERDLKLCMLFLLTQRGLPCLYYGDEIGLPQQTGLPSKEGGYIRTGARTPMRWETGRKNAGFSTARTRDLFLPVGSGPTVEEQRLRRGSLLHLIREIIHARRERPSLGASATFRAAGTSDSLFVCERKSGQERSYIVINPANRPASLSFKAGSFCQVHKMLPIGQVDFQPSGRGMIHVVAGPRSGAVFTDAPVPH